MTRTVRICLAATVAVAAMTMSPSPSSAAPRAPARSGTIAGWGATWVAMFNGEAKDCRWTEWTAGANPECAAWLQSGCNPALAGRDPAVTASIVDVADLADGTTPFVFRWDAIGYPGWGIGGGTVVQLWRRDCTEIRGSKWRSAHWYGPRRWTNRTATTFSIPRGAAWMTVTTNDTANLEWTLTEGGFR